MRRKVCDIVAISLGALALAGFAPVAIAQDADGNIGELTTLVQRQQALIEAQEARLQRQESAIELLRGELAEMKGREFASPAAPAPAPAPSAAVSPQRDGPIVTLGGFIQTDLLYFPDARPGELEDLLYPAAILVDPGVPGRGRFRATARDTRLNLGVRSTTPIGALRGLVEIDFHGSNIRNAQSQFNAFEPRLRHAYAEWTSNDGKLAILAGQTWSLFADPAAYAPTYNSLAMGSIFVRQPQFRVSYRPGNGIILSGSVENPHGVAGGEGRGDYDGQFDGLPDLVLTARLERPWGAVQLGGLIRRIDDRLESDGQTAWGVNASGSLNLPIAGRPQKLRFQAAYGTGIGRYVGELGSGFDGYFVEGQGIVTDRILAANISYQHHLADWLSATLLGSHVEVMAGTDVPGRRVRSLSSGAANLVFHPVQKLDLAFEYMLARRENEDGMAAKRSLLRFTTRYNF